MSPSNESISLFEAVLDRSPAASMLFDFAQESVAPEAVEPLRVEASLLFLEVFSPEAYAGPDRQRELARYCWERALRRAAS
jgi:hypothetical protein